MSIEPLRGPDAISVRELADIRSAGKKHTVLDVREARELDVCRLEGALHVPMAEIPAQTDNLPTDQLLVVICHHGALQSDGRRLSSKRRALTTQSTSTAASMLGLARSTNRCGAIVSVQKEIAIMPLTDSMEKPPAAEPTAGPIVVFSNSYARLPEHFFARRSPAAVAKARLIKFNETLASELGVDTRGLEPDDLAAVFAGNVIPPGAEPLAMAYAGHQFGEFRSQLGDGRANPPWRGRGPQRRAARYPIEGRGPNAVLPGGDGRAALGPVLREYLVSAARHALGIPTTRARLAAVSTGETVFRDRQLPGAVLTRRRIEVHIRIGTFQYFARSRARRHARSFVEHLSGYVVDRHFPEARDS